jgi:cytochrome c oxidase cbb3-type subunit I/II
MPAYAHLATNTLDFASIQKKVDVMVMLGVPYGEAVNSAESMARQQAAAIAEDIQATGGPGGLATREVTAIVAYLQRLGRDTQALPSTAATPAGSSIPATAAVAVPSGGRP